MFEKVVISHLSELTNDTRAVGDAIRYRIYYDNPTLIRADIVTSDQLDKRL